MEGFKIKLNIFSIPLLFTLWTTSYGQNNIATPGYMYENFIKNNLMKLHDLNISNVLIYQTNSLLLGLDNDFKKIKQEDLLTFIIYKESEQVSTIIYIDSVPFKKCNINYDPFIYKELKYLGVVKSENQLHFVPPLVNLVDNEFLLFKIPGAEFYFELSNYATYVPNKHRQKCRDGFAKVLKKNLINCFNY